MNQLAYARNKRRNDLPDSDKHVTTDSSHQAVLDKCSLTSERLPLGTDSGAALAIIRVPAKPTEHKKKRSNPEKGRKYLKQLREKALKANEPFDYARIHGGPDANEWYASCTKEDNAQEAIPTWQLVEKNKLEPNTHVAGCKRVFKVKQDGRKKVRNTFQGHTQKLKLLDDHRSPTVLKVTFFMALQIAVSYKWSFALFDVETAFLNSKLAKEPKVFMRLPDGHPRASYCVALLIRAVYGLKEASRMFDESLRSDMGGIKDKSSRLMILVCFIRMTVWF